MGRSHRMKSRFESESVIGKEPLINRGAGRAPVHAFIFRLSIT